MSMQYIRDHYGVPAKRGRKVEVYYCYGGRWRIVAKGVIASASHLIHVRCGTSGGIPFHPTQGVVYLDDDGSVLLDTRKQGRRNSCEA